MTTENNVNMLENLGINAVLFGVKIVVATVVADKVNRACDVAVEKAKNKVNPKKKGFFGLGKMKK